MQLARRKRATVAQAHGRQVRLADVQVVGVVLAPEVGVVARVHYVTVDGSASVAIVLEVCTWNLS